MIGKSSLLSWIPKSLRRLLNRRRHKTITGEVEMTETAGTSGSVLLSQSPVEADSKAQNSWPRSFSFQDLTEDEIAELAVVVQGRQHVDRLIVDRPELSNLLSDFSNAITDVGRDVLVDIAERQYRERKECEHHGGPELTTRGKSHHV